MKATTFSQSAGIFALLAALSGLLYSISFVISNNIFYSSLFLMLGGFFTSQVYVALFGHLKKINGYFALWATVLGTVGALGMILHGGYDLANSVGGTVQTTNLPSMVDPRGLLSFGVNGMSILVFSALIRLETRFPGNLGVLGYLSGILLLIIYVDRLVLLDPANPLLKYPVLLEGFVINPVWLVWLGAVLRRE